LACLGSLLTNFWATKPPETREPTFPAFSLSSLLF
jgi:hypothetical protein